MKIPAGAGGDLDDKTLLDFYGHNPDGYGVLYVDGDRVRSFKRVGKPQEFLRDWKRFVPYERAVHLRQRTHGDVNYANCHPYTLLHERMFLMHNGILDISTESDKTRSDTWHYIQWVLKPILKKNPELIHEHAFRFLVEQAIGESNKFAVSADGRIYIFNEDAGVQHEGIWYSNTYAWSAPASLYRWKSYGVQDDIEWESWIHRGKSTTTVKPVQVFEASKSKERIVDVLTNEDYETARDLLDNAFLYKASRKDKALFQRYVFVNGMDDFWDLVQEVTSGEIPEDQFVAALEYDSQPKPNYEQRLEVGV